MKKLIIVKFFLFTNLFCLDNSYAAVDYDLDFNEEYDKYGVGVMCGLGTSYSTLGHKLAKNTIEKTKKFKHIDQIAVPFKGGIFFDYNIIEYIGVRLTVNYNNIPLRHYLKIKDVSDIKIYRQIDTIDSHALSVSLSSKIYPFGVQNGLALNLGFELMYRYNINQYKVSNKDGKVEIFQLDKLKNYSQNLFLYNPIFSLEYEFQYIGIILGATFSFSINGLLTDKYIMEQNKNIGGGDKSKLENSSLFYGILSMGYNLTYLF